MKRATIKINKGHFGFQWSQTLQCILYPPQMNKGENLSNILIFVGILIGLLHPQKLFFKNKGWSTDRTVPMGVVAFTFKG